VQEFASLQLRVDTITGVPIVEREALEDGALSSVQDISLNQTSLVITTILALTCLSTMSDTSKSTSEVVHEAHLHRFSVFLDGATEPAILQYQIFDGSDGPVHDLTHTYVPVSMRGRGIAGKLVKFACAHARENNYKIIPSCSYIPVYLQRHPEDLDVVKKD